MPPSVSPEADTLERDLGGADAFELDRRLVRAARLEVRWLARLARQLEEVAREKRYRDAGYNGFDAYVENHVGMSARRARALLRIERAARTCPPLRDAFSSGRLSWVRAHALVPLLLDPGSARHRAAWVEHAQRVGVRRLGDDIDRALASAEFTPPVPGGRPGPAGLQTGARPQSSRESERLFFSASPSIAGLFRSVLATVRRQIERVRGRPATVSDALESMIDHALAAWAPEKKTPRCTGVAPDGLRFELGVRGDGSPLSVYGPGEVLRSAERLGGESSRVLVH